ncbi:MAG: hypothetical protein WA919_17395 [Coleofasciculaceae cyanobacterium]
MSSTDRIHCPLCGNDNPQQLTGNHYRCDQCGTDFIDEFKQLISLSESFLTRKSI